MSEQLTATVPHPELLEVAELYAEGHKKVTARLEKSQVDYEKISESAQQLEVAEALQEKRSVLGQLVGKRALQHLRVQHETARTEHHRNYQLNSSGYKSNKVFAEQHFNDHQEEYYDNAVELAKADGVDIKTV